MAATNGGWLRLDSYVAVAGLAVGFTVGLTGMGGGALMTPILVLLFKVQPLAAISSDLVAAVIMKPIGGGVHWRRGTVNKQLVAWLMVGSVPSAFLGVLVLNHLGTGELVQSRIKSLLGLALLVAAGSIAARGLLSARRAAREALAAAAGHPTEQPFEIKRLPTVIIGILGGLVVGMTSVGSGSLIIVMLLIVYPMIGMRRLVGTDLVQAVPLVGSAALGHLLFGDFKLSLTASLLLGSIPGVYLGAKVSSRANDALVRAALAVVLLASGLRLVGMDTRQVGLIVLGLVLVALPVWGMVDAALQADERWVACGRNKRLFVGLQAAGAPLGFGFLVALVYFGLVRPKVAAAMSPPTGSSSPASLRNLEPVAEPPSSM